MQSVLYYFIKIWIIVRMQSKISFSLQLSYAKYATVEQKNPVVSVEHDQ